MLETVGTSCGDDRIEHCVGFNSFDRCGEEPVLAAVRERTDRVLRPVVRYRDVSVHKPVALVSRHILRVLHRRQKHRLRRRGNRFKLYEEIVKED